MEIEKLKVFSGSSYPELAEKICDELKIKLSPIRREFYPNGCFEVILEEDVRGCSVFIIQTSLPDPALLHIQLFETLQMVNAAYKASAREVTVVLTYFSYSRSDKRWTLRMAINLSLIASFLEVAGMRRMVGVEFHSPQAQSAFSPRVIVDHIVTTRFFAQHLQEKGIVGDKFLILPGDEGFHKRAEKLGFLLKIPVGSVEKTRVSGEEVKINAIHGPIKGRKIIVYDDEILTGRTMGQIVDKAMEMGAEGAILIATHGLFKGNAVANLSSPHIEQIIVTDTLPISPAIKDQLPLTVLSIAPLLAQVIKIIHQEGLLGQLAYGG